MKKKSYLCIQNFKGTRDYEDISYMITHIKDTQVRTSVIEQLGYVIVRVIQPRNLGEKYIFFDKDGNLYMQIIPKYLACNLSKCVKFKREDFKNWLKKNK